MKVGFPFTYHLLKKKSNDISLRNRLLIKIQQENQGGYIKNPEQSLGQVTLKIKAHLLYRIFKRLYFLIYLKQSLQNFGSGEHVYSNSKNVKAS